MDPATLYLVFTLAGGPERTYTGQFWSKQLCEESLARTIERKRSDMTIVNAVCLRRGDYAPDWLAKGAIVDDSLDPKFRP